MALTSTEILLLAMDIALAITVVYLLLKLRSKKKIEPEKEKTQEANAADMSQKTEQDISETTTSELIAPEKNTEKKPLNPNLELRVEALKKEKPGLDEKQVEATPATSDAGERAVLMLEDRPPEKPITTIKDGEPEKVIQKDPLKLEDDIPGEPSSLSKDAEPGAPEKARKTRKRSPKKKAAKKKKPATEEGQAAGDGAGKDITKEDKPEEIQESKPLF